jgi:branched-chain amino acid transport system permease protein
MLAQLLVGGVAQGAVYALVALSMTVLYRATTVVNFGQGDMVMLAAFGVYVTFVLLKLPFLLSVGLVLVLMFALGMGVERWLMRPIRSGSHLSMAMMTVGLGFLLRGLVRYFWGRDVLPIPDVFDFDPIVWGDVVITADNIAIFGAVLAVLVLFFGIFYGTRWGQLVQAVFQSERGAALIGMNVHRFHGIMWGVGALMGAIAGIMIAPLTLLDPDLGAGVLMKAFAAMTLGGFGSLPGCVAGAFGLGIAEQLLGAYVSTALIDITAYLVIVVVLVARPAGLFGRRAVVRV